MSITVTPAPVSTASPTPESTPPPIVRPPATARARKRLWHSRRRIAITVVVCGVLAAAGWFGLRMYRGLTATSEVTTPTAVVQRGDISLSVTAKGELRGGNPQVLMAPSTGGSELHLTMLSRTGQPVKTGETVAQFDTTEQEFKLKEAQADLAEADQHLVQVKAQRDADLEEDRYALLKAQTDLKLAELEVRRNPLLAPITAKQNDLALEGARDHLNQLQQNVANRKATNDAAIAMQEAGRGKAESQATTARQNIDAMTLRAKSNGYVSVHQNTNLNFFTDGMVLPLFQVGDSVRPGMGVAEIPDLNNWEIGANIGELDRGHLTVGDKVQVTIIAVPNRAFTGTVKELGGVTGPFWDRHFECKIALDNPSPELRPGMSAQLTVTTDQLKQVLWLPAQALFESDGRSFVYVRNGKTFSARDVKLLRRNETRVVISGIGEGQVVALSNPLEVQKTKAAGGALQSLPK